MDISEKLRRMSRRTMLGQISTTDRLILNIYKRTAADLAKKAAKAKAGSLDERWLSAYGQQVNDTIREMEKSMEDVITRGVRKTAEGAAAVTQDYLRAVFESAGVSDKFVDTLARVPDDMMRQLIGGKMYKDGRPLSKRIWTECGRLEGNIEEIVAQGVAQQLSPMEIARALEAYVDPDARIAYDAAKLYGDTKLTKLMTNGNSSIDFNALRLARTSMTHVQWATRKTAAKKNPLCQAMHWELSPSHFERQVSVFGEDICDAYANHDEGLGKGNFPVADLPMPHPMCLCTQWEVVPELDEAVKRLRRWIDGGSDPELDKGFGAWTPDFPVDNGGKNGTIKQDDLFVARSLGAKSTIDENEPIAVPGSKDDAFFVPGTRIQNVEVFAGKGTETAIRERYDLEEYYEGTTADDWQKAKGIAHVRHMGEEHKAEIHWYYEDSYGGVEYKVKRQRDGRLWLDES